MTILLRQVMIVDPHSPFHLTRKDVFIAEGKIVKITQDIDLPADRVINIPGLHVSPGWIDIFCHFNDPGYEQKETLVHGAAAAAAGGFTEVMIVPNTSPSISGKAQVNYIVQKSLGLPVKIHPIGAATRNIEGKEIAEMYDMKAEGAVAFSDGWQPIQAAGILLKALQYIKAFKGTLIQVPDDKSIGTYGLMNEGIVSTQMGLPGKPMLAEWIAVERDIQLAAYTASSVHFTGVTTQRSIRKINEAKAQGVNVSCSVTPYHLYFNDADLQDYDTNLKVFPPLRTAQEQTLLREMVLNGSIDCVTSHHRPHEWDSKTCEFEYAQYGMEGLESCYGAVGAALGDALTPERWIELVAINPRKIFGLNVPTLAACEEANITLFDPEATYTFQQNMIYSRSVNNAFVGKTLKGKVWGIIRGQYFHLNSEI